jgi:murein DD-endopeptidase MepM/ murein hydrolase activator NlpD
MSGSVDPKKEANDTLLAKGTTIGQLENNPYKAPFDITEPVMDARNLDDDPLALFRANSVYNSVRYAVDFSTPFGGVAVSDFIPSENNAQENSFNLFGFLSPALTTGFVYVRIESLHSGVLPNPENEADPEIKQLYESLYPKAYVLDPFKVKQASRADLNIKRGTKLQLQALDVNRLSFEVIAVIDPRADMPNPEAGSAFSFFGGGLSSFLGQIDNSRYSGTDRGPNFVYGSGDCSKTGNIGATRDKQLGSLHHAMKDFYLDAVLPMESSIRAGSPPCPRNPVQTPKGRASGNHPGQDISAAVGTPIYAPARGEVVRFTASAKGQTPPDGFVIFHPSIEQQGKRYKDLSKSEKKLFTRYYHCSKVLVRPGDIVTPGQTIALCGNEGKSAGPHLHYEVRYGTGAYSTTLGDVIPPFRVDGSVGRPAIEILQNYEANALYVPPDTTEFDEFGNPIVPEIGQVSDLGVEDAPLTLGESLDSSLDPSSEPDAPTLEQSTLT